MLSLVDNRKWEIINFFLVHPTEEIHLRSLARKVKVSATWAAKVLKELSSEGIVSLRKEKESKMIKVQAERNSSSFIRLKVIFNIYSLYQSGLLDQIITLYQRPEAIVLFGSYRRGEDTEKSDIDIAVITAHKAAFNWSRFEQKLQRKIKIIELIKEKKIEPEFKNTLANGLALYGYLEVVR